MTVHTLPLVVGDEYFKSLAKHDSSHGHISGSYSALLLPSGSAWDPTFMGLEELVTTGVEPEVYLICRGCGKKFLFQKKNITVPLFEMTCTCGNTLEYEKEK